MAIWCELLYLLKDARLAQLVEHPLDVGRVTGSSPVSRTSALRRKNFWAVLALWMEGGAKMQKIISFFVETSTGRLCLESAVGIGAIAIILAYFARKGSDHQNAMKEPH